SGDGTGRIAGHRRLVVVEHENCAAGLAAREENHAADAGRLAQRAGACRPPICARFRQERCRPQGDGAYLTQKNLARPLIAPPGTAPERLTALKAGFAALAHDTDFLADARTAGIDVSPLAGEAVDRIIAMISSAPPETTERLGKAIGSEK